MDHDPGIGQGLALAGCPRSQQKGAHGGGHAEADRLDVAGDEFHGIVNGQTGRNGATG